MRDDLNPGSDTVNVHRPADRRVRTSGAGRLSPDLNIRPHRPPSKAGGRHLFTTLEDESAYLQAAFYGEAVERCVAAVVLSPVIIARGIVKRQVLGASLEVAQAWPLNMQDWAVQAPEEGAQHPGEPICRAASFEASFV